MIITYLLELSDNVGDKIEYELSNQFFSYKNGSFKYDFISKKNFNIDNF